MVKRLSSTDQNDNSLINVPDGVLQHHAVNKGQLDTSLSGKADQTELLEKTYHYGSSRLKSFRAALGDRSNNPVNILFIGDSKTEGNGAGSPDARWMTRFTRGLQHKSNPANVRGGFGYIPAVYGTTDFTSFTLAGSYVVNKLRNADTIGLGKRHVQIASTGTMTITFSGSQYGNPSSVDILYGQSSGAGTFSYSVNGGSPVNVNAAGTLTYGKTVRVTGFSPAGDNTLVISGVSGAVNIEGIMHFVGDETSGIRAWDAAHSGTRADWVNVPTDGWWNTAASISPSLVYLSLGRNDFSTGTSLADIRADLEGIITKVRTLTPNPPSIIFGMDWEDAASAPVDTYANFHAAMRDMVLTDGDIAFFDAQSVIGKIKNSMDNVYSLTGDYTHLNAKGHQMFADAFIEFVEQCVGTIPSVNKVTGSGGWYVYDYGSHYEYRKRVTYSTGTLGAGLGFLIADETLPPGHTNMSRLFFTVNASVSGAVAGDATILLKPESHSTKVQAYIVNSATSNRSWAGAVDIHLVENP